MTLAVVTSIFSCSVAVLCKTCIARAWHLGIHRYPPFVPFFRLAFSSGVAMKAYFA